MQSSFIPNRSGNTYDGNNGQMLPHGFQNPNIPFDFNKVYGNLKPGMMGGGNPMMGSSPIPQGSSPAPNNSGFTNPGMLSGGLSSLAGGMLSGDGGFGGYSNPSDPAMKYLDQIPGQMKPYYDPYINAGNSSIADLQKQYGSLTGNLSGLQNQYSQLMNNPGAMLGKIGGGFQESPGYKFQQGQAMNAANNAAAAGGMLGSPQHQQQAAEMTQGLANQDYYNYLNKALGAYGGGLSGATNLYGLGLSGQEGLSRLGYGASSGLAQNLAQALMSKANLAYSGQANLNNMRMAQDAQDAASDGAMWGGIGNLAGGIFGGPIGSAIGGWAANKLR